MTGIGLEALKNESVISFPAMKGPDVIPWESALPQLQAMLQAQKLETTVAELTQSVALKPNPTGEGYVGISTRTPKTLTKKQLESILLLSPGYIQVEVGELIEPVERDGKKLSLVIALEHKANRFDKHIRQTGSASIYGIWGIEKDGTAHVIGTQY